jgi:hypothetical protein
MNRLEVPLAELSIICSIMLLGIGIQWTSKNYSEIELLVSDIQLQIIIDHHIRNKQHIIKVE